MATTQSGVAESRSKAIGKYGGVTIGVGFAILLDL
jgi:hypothetical protein